MKRPNKMSLFLVLIFLIWGAGLLEGQAQAGGYITGTVRDAITNNPISGIYVDAYEVNFGYVSTGCTNPSSLTNTTDANGQYGFCVYDGLHKVFFRRTDASISYVGRWWDGASSFSGATPISVGGGINVIPKPDINVTMTTSGGGFISGKATGPNDVGISGVNVFAYDHDQIAESKHGLASAVTDANGNYTITAPLPPGGYKIKCNDGTSGNNNLPEWWNDKTDILTADPLAVVAMGPNSANCKFSAGGIISGNVTDSAHNPISDAQITVYDPNQKSTASGTTDAAGNYSAKRLRSGNYKVLFKGPYGSTLAYEWYNNQSAFSAANGVLVTAGSTTPNIDAQLLEGGTITGSTGTATGVLAKVYDPYQTLVASAISEANGAFSVVGLPTGMYRVEFIKYNLASTWYNGHRTFDSADWVLVTAPAPTSGINGSLLPAQVISGTVTNTQGAGIPKVTVRAYDGPTFKPMSSTSLTNSLGQYTLNYLSSGSTLVYYDSQGTGYYPEWWDDKKIMAEANPIILVPGVAYPNRDAVLDPSQEVYLPLIHKN